jgi:signal transduction histidine kinase
MDKAVHDVADEMSAAHPDRRIDIESRGTQRGEWDCARMTQAVSNLVGNALEHGAKGSTVSIAVRDEDDGITISVHNYGPMIPADRLDGIFNPMKQSTTVGGALGQAGNLGLGLYIADRIVHAHNGRIVVESSESGGTTFTVHLPRPRPAAAQASNGAGRVNRINAVPSLLRPGP